VNPASLPPHPDRLAPTLAARELLPPAAFAGPFAPPGADAADARADLKLLAARAFRALHARGTDAAFARLHGLWSEDLWAGTVQDATARGFASALEDALSLCAPAPPEPPFPDPRRAHEVTVVTGRELARRKDLLVASEGPRVRWSRKGGVQYVDRALDLNVEHAVWFEDRADLGTLDRFVPDERRPRLYSPQFLRPESWEQGPERDLLVLAGRLGPRARGFPVRLTFEGRKNEAVLRLTVALENRFPDHRLRIRFAGLRDPGLVDGDANLPVTAVAHDRGAFLACTLVRACGRLDVGGTLVPVPAAQCLGALEHRFVLGRPP
jgi:hypothetical protein